MIQNRFNCKKNKFLPHEVIRRRGIILSLEENASTPPRAR